MEQKTYTVGELIKTLKQFPSDMPVDVRGTDYYGAKGGRDIAFRTVDDQYHPNPFLIICGYDNWDDFSDEEDDTEDETDI